MSGQTKAPISRKGSPPATRQALRATLCLAVGLVTACVPVWSKSFKSLEPLAPRIVTGSDYPEVDSLQPELRWTPAKEHEGGYDLAVWDPGFGPDRGEPVLGKIDWGVLVYGRAGIKGTTHRVETPLKPNTMYFWSVRTRQGTAFGEWSTYDAWLAAVGPFGGSGRQIRNSPFRFKTPAE